MNNDYFPLPDYYMFASMRKEDTGISVGFYMFCNVNDGFRPDLEYHVRYVNGKAVNIRILSNAS